VENPLKWPTIEVKNKKNSFEVIPHWRQKKSDLKWLAIGGEKKSLELIPIGGEEKKSLEVTLH
jgi:hypothetical protein